MRRALLLRGVGKYASAQVCGAIVGRPTRSMPSLMDCASSPEGQPALTPLHQVGDPEKLGVLRLNWRTSDRRELAALRQGQDPGHATPGPHDRGGRRTTPHNHFTVHDFPNAGHPGPSDPTRVTDVLHGLPL
ncbi:hypothetical protein [Streptomyces canus]|uniref:hypothetical protein n=1 Tax=Streptomyces canus TaxID=58343 RepID=UPI00298E8450|nr:hypothetical protein [Streptomyces canus]